MTQIVPFELEHYDRMGGLREPMSPAHFGTDYRVLLDAYRQRGLAWSLLDGDEVIACGGIVILWPGVGEAWTVMGEKVKDYPLAVAKALREGIERSGLRRIQATVRIDDGKARKLIGLCGFKPEGILEGFGPDGADFVSYARVR